MTMAEQQRRELARFVRRCQRSGMTIREAAKHVGIPKSTLFDFCKSNGIRWAS